MFEKETFCVIAGTFPAFFTLAVFFRPVCSSQTGRFFLPEASTGHLDPEVLLPTKFSNLFIPLLMSGICVGQMPDIPSLQVFSAE
ncbi:MAG: hypothetical protein J5569_06455 [Oscillospiraceae bacterium]|nr:hypothetical protein [Oscillospiraceae bacterium]